MRQPKPIDGMPSGRGMLISEKLLSAPQQQVLWLGPATGEFQHSFTLLKKCAPVRLCADLSTLVQWAALPNMLPPEIVVGASAWPGAWNNATLEQLSRLWPLTRWIELLGAWSSGTARTASSWAGWEQVPAGEFEWSAEELLDPSAAPLPRTATREERLLSRHQRLLRPGTRVGVISRQRNQLFPLVELLESLGCLAAGHWQQTAELAAADTDSWREFSPDVLLVNLGVDLMAALPWLRSLKARWPTAPLALLADAPRPDEVELAHSQNLGPLLGKPVSAERLSAALQSALSKSKCMVH